MISKRITTIVLIIILATMVFGCSRPQENQTESSATSATPTATTVQETETTTEQTTTAVPDELEGFELLQSINYSMPDSYISETTVNSYDVKSIIKTYYKDKSQRTEIENSGVRSISIYNDKEGVTYMYNEGDSIGFMTDTFDNTYYGEENTSVNWEDTSLAEAYADQPIVEAKIVTVDGKKALYIELDNSYDGYDQTTRFWYSLDYPILYRYEIEDSSSMVVVGETTNLEIDVPLDDSLFEKPEGIEFQKY